MAKAEIEITKTLNDFPHSPRVYSELFDQNDTGSVEIIRSAVQEDLQRLAVFEAEKLNIEGVAKKLDQQTEAHLKARDEVASLQKKVDTAQRTIAEKESFTGVSIDQQGAIRDAHSSAVRRLAELTSTRSQVEENL